VVLLAACQSQPVKSPASSTLAHAKVVDGPPADGQLVDISQIPDAVPKPERRTRAGNKNPYTVFGKTYYLLPNSEGYRKTGVASWYGTKFHGRRTANGEVYNMYAMTAAHKTLPIPTYVRVTNLANGRQVVVKVNDRGPFHGKRLIDLSYAAAKRLGFVRQGTAKVKVEAIDTRHKSAVAQASKAKTDILLQVGAFNDLTRARQLETKLSRLTSLPVHIKNPAGQPRGLYRVRVGPLPNLAQAQNLSSKIAAARLGKPLLINQPVRS
jgi:rare lipoprotein A